MTIPTTCTNCGLGQEHICERSVCPCLCHEDEVVSKPPDLSYVMTAIEQNQNDWNALDLHALALRRFLASS